MNTTKVSPVEVTADKAAVYPRVSMSWPPTCHHTEQYANNQMQTGHGQLKRRLHPMRGRRPTAEPQLSSLGMHSCEHPPRTL
jgi:transposase-like protein